MILVSTKIQNSVLSTCKVRTATSTCTGKCKFVIVMTYVTVSYLHCIYRRPVRRVPSRSLEVLAYVGSRYAYVLVLLLVRQAPLLKF